MKGSKIITSYVNPPIPARAFDWCAYFDGDEGDETAPVGRGATERAAIIDLMDKAEMDLPQDAETAMWARAGK